MKKKLITLITTTIFMFGLAAQAVILPHNLRLFLFDNVQGASIRFDGLINYPDGTIYIPVLPAKSPKVASLEVKYTYPTGKKFSDKPDVILFNNNYALLKVIKDGKRRTVTSYSDLPTEIKTGLLPQDMLVPNGFYIPESLVGILGDVEIPVVSTDIKSDINKTTVAKAVQQKAPAVKQQKTGKKVIKSQKRIAKGNVPQELQDKMYLVTNFDSRYLKVFTAGRPEPVYGLKLKGVLKDLKPTPDKRYLLTAVFGKTEVDVADINNEQIAKSIDTEAQPSEILIDSKSNKAYILTTEGKAVFIVNLATMSITEKIKLDAVPYRMTLSPDGTQLAYADKTTDTVYILKLEDEYKNIPVTTFTNVSKIILDGNNRLYTVSRTQNLLTATDYDLNKPYTTGEEDNPKGVLLQKKYSSNMQKLLGGLDFMPEKANSQTEQQGELEKEFAAVNVHKFKTGSKPTEMYLYDNKLYILCSGENSIQILDTNTLKLTKTIKIPYEGFARRIVRIDNSDAAIITDVKAKKYSVLNLKTSTITGTYPIDTPVNSLTIVNKINNINLPEESL